MPEICYCLLCNKEFTVSPSDIKDGGGKYCSRKCRGLAQSGENHPNWRGGKVKRICQNCLKEFNISLWPSILKRNGGKFCSSSCHMVFLRKHGYFRKHPNHPEQKILELCKSFKLPFKYVGNGEVWLGNRNPDFININGRKQVIELFGTYWHSIFDVASRIEHYKQYGFSTLIIWEDELTNTEFVIKKIRRFNWVVTEVK